MKKAVPSVLGERRIVEMDPASGRGWAVPEQEKVLKRRIHFPGGEACPPRRSDGVRGLCQRTCFIMLYNRCKRSHIKYILVYKLYKKLLFHLYYRPN